MDKAYKFGLYLKDDQIILINKTFWCTRIIYNYFLARSKNMCNNNI